MGKTLLIAAALVAGVLTATGAGAVSLNDTVSCNATGTSLTCSPVSAVVGAGAEFQLTNRLRFTQFTFDFSPDALTITSGPAFSIGSTNSVPVYISITDTTNPFINARLVSATGHLDDGTTFNPNIDQSNFTVVDGVLKFDLIGPGGTQYSNATIKLDLSPAATTPVVPEPATWAMMIAGFALAGSAMRRREGEALLPLRAAADVG